MITWRMFGPNDTQREWDQIAMVIGSIGPLVCVSPCSEFVKQIAGVCGNILRWFLDRFEKLICFYMSGMFKPFYIPSFGEHTNCFVTPRHGIHVPL